jgi:hypothetical protein
MQNKLRSNDQRISGYLDSLLLDTLSVEEQSNQTLSDWDQKLARAVAPDRSASTMNRNVSLSVIKPLGKGNNSEKRTQLFSSLSLARCLPESRLKRCILVSCLPLAAEAMISG